MHKMKNTAWVFGSMFGAGLICLTAGCVEREVVRQPPPPQQQVVYVQKPPPPPIVEVQTAPPGPLSLWMWQGGHWRWDGAQYRWFPGHWGQRPREAAVWVAPHWEQHPNGWFMVEGTWR